MKLLYPICQGGIWANNQLWRTWLNIYKPFCKMIHLFFQMFKEACQFKVLSNKINHKILIFPSKIMHSLKWEQWILARTSHKICQYPHTGTHPDLHPYPSNLNNNAPQVLSIQAWCQYNRINSQASNNICNHKHNHQHLMGRPLQVATRLCLKVKSLINLVWFQKMFAWKLERPSILWLMSNKSFSMNVLKWKMLPKY